VDILLGIDLGTTNCKVIAMDAYGNQVAAVTALTPVHDINSEGLDYASGTPGYDAEDLWDVCAKLIRQIKEKLKSKQTISALAVASMGEAGVLVDSGGNPLMPILTWHDRRTLPWVEWWRKRISYDEIFNLTGLPLDHTYSASKILWYRDQNPDIFRHTHAWLSLADWITFRLTGEYTTTHSMASRTMFLDLNKRAWSDDLFYLADLPRNIFPPLLPSGEVVGYINLEASRTTDLSMGIPVVTAGHDNICAALAAGVTTPGVVLDSAGTFEAMLITLDTPKLESTIAAAGLSCGCHVVRDRYYLVGGIMSGAIVDWLTRLFTGYSDPNELAKLINDASLSPPLSNGVVFLPYLSGSGSPDISPKAWGAWLRLHLTNNRADMVRSVFEGLSFALRYLLESIQNLSDFPAKEIRVVGGGSRNTWWQDIKADIFSIPIEIPIISEVTAQGAAILAGIGIGVFRDEGDAIARTYRPSIRYEPDPGKHAEYTYKYHDVFLTLHRKLRNISDAS
jgi:sugar (pentulose or hexulose) kinase